MVWNQSAHCIYTACCSTFKAIPKKVGFFSTQAKSCRNKWGVDSCVWCSEHHWWDQMISCWRAVDDLQILPELLLSGYEIVGKRVNVSKFEKQLFFYLSCSGKSVKMYLKWHNVYSRGSLAVTVGPGLFPFKMGQCDHTVSVKHAWMPRTI